MFKIVCVTDRKSCREDFFARLDNIAAAKPDRIILREKELTETDYAAFAERSINICHEYDIPCSIHTYPDIAEKLNAGDIHLPITVLRSFSDNITDRFRTVGVSVHSAEEAAEAENLGADYVTAGHIFETGCKKGLPPRGLNFLENVCKNVDIPVYAIGGIDPENISGIRNAGAAGACIMNGFMTCNDPVQFIRSLRESL